MILSDIDIMNYIVWGNIQIDPFKPENLSPASLDLRLGDHFIVDQSFMYEFKDSYNANMDDSGKCSITEKDSIIIPPKQFLLATTIEKVNIPNTIAAQVNGRSSIGRLGLSVHITAGWIDPGFSGQITLELFNCSNDYIEIEIGRRICQLIFHRLNQPCQIEYGAKKDSKYQNQTGTTQSKFIQDKEVIIDE